MSVLAQVDRHHFAPEQQPLYQHPAEGCHEEKMQQGRHERAGHLGSRGQKATGRGQRSVTRSKHKHMENVRVLTTHDENVEGGKEQHMLKHKRIWECDDR